MNKVGIVVPCRIHDQTYEELKAIGVEEDRAIGWLIRFACDSLVKAYKKDPNVVRPPFGNSKVLEVCSCAATNAKPQ